MQSKEKGGPKGREGSIDLCNALTPVAFSCQKRKQWEQGGKSSIASAWMKAVFLLSLHKQCTYSW